MFLLQTQDTCCGLGTAASLLFHRTKLEKLTSHQNILPSLHNNPEHAPSSIYGKYGKKIAMLFYSFSTLNSHHQSLLIVTQYLNIKIFLFLLPIHFYIHKKPSSHIYINLFLLLLPRSAHIIPPHPFTHILQQNNITLLQNTRLMDLTYKLSPFHFIQFPIRQVRYNTFLSGYQLPWSPSNCLN